MKTCGYCLLPAALLKHGEPGYPYRSDYGPTWTCVSCQAWVGCHPGTENALGRLANAELRAAKQAAHAAFDPLWRRKIEREGCSKGHARRAGYRWLAQQLGLPVKKTHIGFMSLEECRRVVEICTNRGKKNDSNRVPADVADTVPASEAPGAGPLQGDARREPEERERQPAPVRQ